MKLKKLIFILIPLIFIGFAACNDKPIFATIEQEIKLKKFSVEGNILSLLQAGDYVYASNHGGVYTKLKTSDGSWDKISSVLGTQYLAKNDTDVFVCSATGPVKFYNGSPDSWTNVPSSENIHIIAGNKIVFGYDSSQKKVFKIEKTGLSNHPTDTGEVHSLSAAGNYVLVKSKDSAKLYKDGDPAAVPGLPSGSAAICPADLGGGAGADDKIFVLAGSTIHYYNGVAWSAWDSSISTSGRPDNISYFEAGTRKTILIGCTKGYTEIKVNSTTPAVNLSQLDPGAEGSTTPSSSYSQYQATLGNYYSAPVLGVSSVDNEYAIFMGIHSGVIKRNTGLWGFYSDKKREWNRE